MGLQHILPKFHIFSCRNGIILFQFVHIINVFLFLLPIETFLLQCIIFIFIFEVCLFLSLMLSVDRQFQHFKNGIPLFSGWCISNEKLPVISPILPQCSVCFPLVLGIVTLSLFLPVWMWHTVQTYVCGLCHMGFLDSFCALTYILNQ